MNWMSFPVKGTACSMSRDRLAVADTWYDPNRSPVLVDTSIKGSVTSAEGETCGYCAHVWLEADNLPTSAVLSILLQHHVWRALADEPLPQWQADMAAARLPKLAHMETYKHTHARVKQGVEGWISIAHVPRWLMGERMVISWNVAFVPRLSGSTT